MTGRPGRLRVAVVTDTTLDARHLDGLHGAFDLTLITPAALAKPTNVMPTESVDSIRLGRRRSTFPFHAARHLRRHRERFDVVLAIDDLSAALGANLGRFAGGPPVVVLLGRPVLEYLRCQRRNDPRWVARYLLAWVLVQFNDRVADGIDAVSRYVANDVQRRNRNVVPIAWYGVDTDLFAPEVSREDARARLRLPTDRPIVLWRSRVAPEKDPDTFVEAIDLLHGRGRDVLALYQGGEHAAMGEVARQYGVAVHLADRVEDLRDMVWWYRAADVVIQTSHAEGLGMSPLEALACETPIVVTDTGGLPEAAAYGRCGLLVPPNDPTALAEALESLLDDPARRAELGRQGRQHVLAHYRDVDAFQSRIELLTSVASRHRAQRRG